MNVLILTCKFGMGHFSAALALEEEIKNLDPSCNVKVIDFIEHMVPKADALTYGTFNFVVDKCPNVYNFLNEVSAKNSGVPLGKLLMKKISKLLENIDIVISTVPISTQYISSFKQTKNCQIPLYTYVTDIVAHKEWLSGSSDMYFVGDISSKEQLIQEGIDQEKIKVTGIPVRKGFDFENKKNKYKEILIMGGGLGLIPNAEEVILNLSSKKEIKITVITGKNKKLMKTMKKNFPNIKVIGYSNHVNDYMKKADLVVSKAGGITVFEAIHTKTPLYIIKPFLMQEVGNAKFVEEKNIGKIVWKKKKDIAEDIVELLNDEEKIKIMKENMQNILDGFENYTIFDAYLSGRTKC